MAQDQTLAVKVTTLVAAGAAAWAAQKVLASAWERSTGHAAPKDPLDTDARLGAIVAFAAITGGIAALTKVLATRGARKVLGSKAVKD